MIDISRAEADYLRKSGRGNDVHMANQRHKSHAKKYFVTTSPKTMRLLEDYRKQHTLEVYDGR